MSEYKDKGIKILDHEITLKVKGDKAAKVGPELIEHLKTYSESQQETFD